MSVVAVSQVMVTDEPATKLWDDDMIYLASKQQGIRLHKVS